MEVTVHCGPFKKRLRLSSTQEKYLLDTEYVPRGLLSGPPGCGKSVVLMLKGLQWLREEQDVLVLGLHTASMPGCRLVYQQLVQARKEAERQGERRLGQVRWHHTILRDSSNLEATLDAVLKHVGCMGCILMDDFCPDDGFGWKRTCAFLKELKARVSPKFHLWASTFKATIPEDFFSTFILNESFRYPIPIVREVNMALNVLSEAKMLPETHVFTDNWAFASHYLADIIHVHPKGKTWPLDSKECGKQVARQLKAIGVGGTSATGEHYDFRDVLVVSRCGVDPSQPAPPFVRGLEASGIPTQVFGQSHVGDTRSVEDDFDHLLLASENKVTVMNFMAARGLDRAVVVCLTGAAGEERYELNDEENRDLERSMNSSYSYTEWDRLGRVIQSVKVESRSSRANVRRAREITESELKYRIHQLEIWSRASCQMIVVHLPKYLDGGPSDSDNYGPRPRKCVIL